MGSSPGPVTAVIAAAGSGQRLGAGGPKALVDLGGRPLVEWPLEAMLAAPSIGAIVLAAPPGEVDRFRALSGPLEVVAGGERRAESVRNALEQVETELVAIHDAARPLLTAELVEGVIATLVADPGADGAITAAPVNDTIKRAGGSSAASAPSSGGNAALDIVETVDRAELWAAQTPQVFRAEALRRALEADPGAAAAATDEAMIVEAAGGRVKIHPTPAENLKVTTAVDLRLAESLIRQRKG